ncbi:thiamine pyrophosphate-dependent enzyme [Campylobacter troglodytis]|uniref:thiamine pyrophosphate-dependent enzyme n=1 Tax=Campylobacter troglodytis TaxID=654363 RepID=UPI0011582678|nr:thiamine pyrophosphate-dependent enzyme [Campylobacter troglodytis]TQR59612.1 phosphonopyruvate decarboxylase [Campylobacter troglodytis]
MPNLNKRLNPTQFALFLKEHIGLFAGVPDSLLKPLNSALNELSKDNFYTTANEGEAIAFACAYHLATKNLGLVYMQNSGLGNAINPLLSLADKLVYKIPLVMIIGLRGGIDDEPQHRKQGLVTRRLLSACGIKHFILSKNFKTAKKQCLKAFEECLKDESIVAILVEKDSFAPFEKASLSECFFEKASVRECLFDKAGVSEKSPLNETVVLNEKILSFEKEGLKESCDINKTVLATKQKNFDEDQEALSFKNEQALSVNLENLNLKRERAIELILAHFKEAKFICSTGHIGRECYDLREKKKQGHSDDFLVVGSMGFASSIAFVLSQFTQKRIICLDGDGAFLMHLGAISNFKGANFIHIVLNNFAHESVGGQESCAKNVNFNALAKACGYELALSVSDEFSLKKALNELKGKEGLIFIEILVAKGARKDLGRPKDILALKEEFCKNLH